LWNEQKKRKTRIKEKRGPGVGQQGALSTKSFKKMKERHCKHRVRNEEKRIIRRQASKLGGGGEGGVEDYGESRR
jgi:hypothetical protein